ncbi:MAG: DUF2807 domain-containing protein [Flavobacterium sp.]|nr:DUF2807 domain-containing protein [Flavobacterium sp.]
MKSKILLLLLPILTFGQINGSGKIITKSYSYKNFDKVNLTDLAGKVAIEVGKPWSIKADIDDNLQDFLDFSLNDAEQLLTISFKGNRSNKMYIEDTNVKITITMPEISVISQDGNTNTNISNLLGRYIRIENFANGNITASGKVDKVDIQHSGNGDVNAKKLVCGTAAIKSSGNGDVFICANDDITASGSGNGDIINSGKASFSDASVKRGNGKLINK